MDDTDGDLCRSDVSSEFDTIYREVAIDERKGKQNYAYLSNWLAAGLKQLRTASERDSEEAADGVRVRVSKRQFADPEMPWVVSSVPWYKIFSVDKEAFMNDVVDDWNMHGDWSKARTQFGRRLSNLCGALVLRHFSDICTLGHKVTYNAQAVGANKPGPKAPFLRVFLDCRIPCCNARFLAVIRRRWAENAERVYIHISAIPNRSLTILPQSMTACNETRMKIGNKCTLCFIRKNVVEAEFQFQESYVSPFIPNSRVDDVKLAVRRDTGLRGPRRVLNEDVIFGLFRRSFGANHRTALNVEDQSRIFFMLGFENVKFEVCRKWMETYIITCKAAKKLTAGHGRKVKLSSPGVLRILSEQQRLYISSNQPFWKALFGSTAIGINNDFNVDDEPNVFTAILDPQRGSSGEISDLGEDLEQSVQVFAEVDLDRSDENVLEQLSQRGIFSQQGEVEAAIEQIKYEPESDDGEPVTGSFEVPANSTSPTRGPVSSSYRRRNIFGRRRGQTSECRRANALISSSMKRCRTVGLERKRRFEQPAEDEGFDDLQGSVTLHTEWSKTTEVQTEEPPMKLRRRTQTYTSDVPQTLHLGEKKLPGLFVGCRETSDLFGVDARNMYIPLTSVLRASFEKDIDIGTILHKMPSVCAKGKQAGGVTAQCSEDPVGPQKTRLERIVGRVAIEDKEVPTDKIATTADASYVSLDTIRNL